MKLMLMHCSHSRAGGCDCGTAYATSVLRFAAAAGLSGEAAACVQRLLAPCNLAFPSPPSSRRLPPPPPPPPPPRAACCNAAPSVLMLPWFVSEE
jgi:hypothetical protein